MRASRGARAERSWIGDVTASFTAMTLSGLTLMGVADQMFATQWRTLEWVVRSLRKVAKQTGVELEELEEEEEKS